MHCCLINNDNSGSFNERYNFIIIVIAAHNFLATFAQTTEICVVVSLTIMIIIRVRNIILFSPVAPAAKKDQDNYFWAN